MSARERVVDPKLIQEAVALARQLQERAMALQTPEERHQQAELDRLIQHPADKATLIQLTDQAFRTRRAGRAAEQLTHILDVQGVPRFFSPLDRTLLRGFRAIRGLLAGVTVPLVKQKMRQETAKVVLPAEPRLLRPHLRARRREGVRMNLNYLGEALLGEGEAVRRLERYLAALRDPDVEVISVKISTIFSQLSSLAWEHTLEILCARLAQLYRVAAAQRFTRADGCEVPKLVYLDMEAYRDMAVTAEAFMRTLDRPGLQGASAGIALQAYLPDAFATQRRITAWAQRRLAEGGAPITLRIVKGANMEMERVEASLHGWPAAPFQSKRETDANYKRMLCYAMQPAHARAVHLGVASHNLFDLAFALVLARHRGVLPQIHLEMLEGMASHQRRALQAEGHELLLYAPACHREEFVHAIGYMVRRLDENTGPQNFLRHAFRLRVGSEAWQHLEGDFVAAFQAIPGLADAPRRRQDRHQAPVAPPARPWPEFQVEPDTDFSLPQNIAWAKGIYAAWHRRCEKAALAAPLVVAGRELREGRRVADAIDPSRPGVVVGHYCIARPEDVERAVACARADPERWRGRCARERGEILGRVAQRLRERRAELMGIALAEAGKILPESDPEVSEAVDFCELYGRSAEALASLPCVAASPRGVVVVVPPWNFPIAIPCGGMAAGLAAGNTVILKPAPESVLCAWLLCQCFWEAGVPRTALQFVYGENETQATQLVTHRGVDTVIFTGGTRTAFRLLGEEPGMRLLAETGGKNASIVTALSDRELAIQHVVHAAFGHAGQKCSATSLLILEREVYRDAAFRRSLCDAVESLPVGSAWDPATRVGPLIRPPREALRRALQQLEPGESWALVPRQQGDNPRLWSPGVKWGVQPGSFTHTTELFGPLLGVMCAHDLDEAISLVHQTGYGLTCALHSLDDREQAHWCRTLRAGNLYVNRGTTGAVVMRQPFGGMARSAVGPGLKAGGPNYVASLMRFQETRLPGELARLEDPEIQALLRALEGRNELVAAERERLRRAAGSYRFWMRREFGREHDLFRLIGQDNLRRYLPVERLHIRMHPDDTGFDVLARLCAARIAGCSVTVSVDPACEGRGIDWLQGLTADWSPAVDMAREDDEALAALVAAGQIERVRYAAPERVSDVVRQAAARAGLYLAVEPVLAEGRIELLHYLREQSLCIDYHRYGNLGARADEDRSPVT